MLFRFHMEKEYESENWKGTLKENFVESGFI